MRHNFEISLEMGNVLIEKILKNFLKNEKNKIVGIIIEGAHPRFERGSAGGRRE